MYDLRFDGTSVMSAVFKIIDFILEEFLIGKCIRNLTFLLDDIYNDIQKTANSKTTEIISGSSSEGMLNSGDIDVMICCSDFIVVNSPSKIPSDCNSGVLLLNVENCYPGFANLTVLKEKPDINDDLYSRIDGKTYLNREKYMTYVCKQIFGKANLDMHGPAVLQSFGAADLVICLACTEWPECAMEFMERIRDFDVPSAVQLDHIRDMGCHIILISHPDSSNPDLEIRLSFSAAEKYLIRQWTNPQIKCYFLCKELFSNCFKAQKDSEKSICSYFAKSIILWMAEKNPSSFWSDSTTFKVMEKIFATLKVHLTEKSCPNYFIPTNFMMKTFSNDQAQLLLNKLCSVENDIVSAILSCETVKKLSIDIEILHSLYLTVNSIGDVAMQEEILESIYREMLMSFDQKKGPKGACVSRARDLYQFVSVCHLVKFMTLCLNSIWVYHCHPVPVLTDVLSRISDDYGSVHSQWQLQFFKNCLERCIALHMINLAFMLENDEETTVETFQAVEALLISSSQFPMYLNDLNTSGKVYLGLLYYILDRHENALQVLHEAVFSAGVLIADNFGSLIAVPIVICGSEMKAPKFLRRNQTLCELFEDRHLHVITFDPLALALFLIISIYETKKTDKKKGHMIRFSKLSEYLDATYERRGPIYKSTFDSYYYMRYKLGLLEDHTDEFKVQSQPATCFFCND